MRESARAVSSQPPPGAQTVGPGVLTRPVGSLLGGKASPAVLCFGLSVWCCQHAVVSVVGHQPAVLRSQWRATSREESWLTLVCHGSVSRAMSRDLPDASCRCATPVQEPGLPAAECCWRTSPLISPAGGRKVSRRVFQVFRERTVTRLVISDSGLKSIQAERRRRVGWGDVGSRGEREA